jgi:hypothetical protein
VLEDTAEPSVVDGGIPPNKSDLKAFGVFTESGEVTEDNPTGKFLELFWTRVQDPSGTTNMDFELNQKFCDLSATPTNCASNGITPLRTVGDKLITYDLDRGGTRATISIRTWEGTAWGDPTVLTQQNPVQALGTINTTPILGENSLVGPLSARTFGEASISYSALFGGETCGQFGSAYLKSRASDSFTAALKDFVPPEQVNISNCSALSTTPNPSSGTVGVVLKDSASLTNGVNPQGSIEFKLFAPGDTDCSGTPVFTETVNVNNGNGTYNTTNGYTSDTVGTYRWTAKYTSSNANNTDAESGCQDEQVTISPAAANIDTAQELFPQDSATLSATAGGTPTGTVDFALYGPNDANCSGTPVYTKDNVTLTNGVANTDNTTFSVNQAKSGDYKWIVHYDGDATHNEATSQCGKEAFTAMIDNDTNTP